jgi:hypothetical protein
MRSPPVEFGQVGYIEGTRTPSAVDAGAQQCLTAILEAERLAQVANFERALARERNLAAAVTTLISEMKAGAVFTSDDIFRRLGLGKEEPLGVHEIASLLTFYSYSYAPRSVLDAEAWS